MNGWNHQLTQYQMIGSTQPQVSDEHARGGWSGFRLPRKELPHLRLKSQPQIRRMAHDMLHGCPEPGGVGATAATGTVHLGLLNVECAGSRDPRRRAQCSKTAEDQRIAHMAASRVLV